MRIANSSAEARQLVLQLPLLRQTSVKRWVEKLLVLETVATVYFYLFLLFYFFYKKGKRKVLSAFPMKDAQKLERRLLWSQEARRENLVLKANSKKLRSTFGVRIPDKSARPQRYKVGMKVSENIEESPRGTKQPLTVWHPTSLPSSE